MMTVSLIIVGSICLVGLIVAVIGIAIVMNSTDRDTVSAAREGWIQGRGGEDGE